MIEYIVKIFEENKMGSELMGIHKFYDANKADAFAREMSWLYDWIEVSNSEEEETTCYIQGRIY